MKNLEEEILSHSGNVEGGMKFAIDSMVFVITFLNRIPGTVYSVKKDDDGNWIYRIKVSDEKFLEDVKEKEIRARIVSGEHKYNKGDMVEFETYEDSKKTGTIWVVDAYGTMEQDEEASYDIWVEAGEERCLYKHIRESKVIGLGKGLK